MICLISAITLLKSVQYWHCYPWDGLDNDADSHGSSSTLASSMFAPGIPQVMRDFHSTNTELAPFILSVYLLGLAAGPL